jgi:Signal transduction histidine kinase
MAMILSGVELFEDYIEDKQKVAEFADAVKQSILRLKHVTTVMMRYGKPSETVRILTDVNGLLQQAMLLAEFECRQQGIVLKNNFQAVPKIALDANAFSQVFMNIILNSIQAISTEGVIEINTKLDKGESDETFIQVMFIDSGKGLSSDKLKRVFEPFYTSKEGNAGLGMPMILKTVDAHEGSVSVSSCEGEYTCITLSLPCGNLKNAVEKPLFHSTESN